MGIYSVVINADTIRNTRGVLGNYYSKKLNLRGEKGSAYVIYMLLGKGELLYIGYTGNYKERIKAHVNGYTKPSNSFYKAIDTVVLVDYENYDKLRKYAKEVYTDLEAHLIKELKPKHNVQYT